MEAKIISVVETTVEELKDELFDLTRNLVRIPSVVGQEEEAQEFMARQYSRAGLEVELFEAQKEKIESHPFFIDSGLPFAGRPNVIGRQPGDPAKRSLILNGHIDVVSPEPVDQWSHDPWGGEILEGRLYGRGSLDMKAGLAANLTALKALARAGLDPGGSVILQSVIEEEAGGGGGTLACLAEGYQAEAMFCTEPGLTVCVAHAGVLYFRVRVEGRTAHAGRAHEGVNAIGKLIPIFQALSALDDHRRLSISYPLFQIEKTPACHLNLGRMNGGDWPSTVPGFAHLEGRISFVPGETRSGIRDLVEKTVQEAALPDPWLQKRPPTIEWFGWQAEPWVQDPNHPFIHTVTDCVQVITDGKVRMDGKPAGLDTRFAGYYGIPAVSFGPVGESLHGCDEYVDLDSLVMVTKAVALTALSWCSEQKA